MNQRSKFKVFVCNLENSFTEWTQHKVFSKCVYGCSGFYSLLRISCFLKAHLTVLKMMVMRARLVECFNLFRERLEQSHRVARSAHKGVESTLRPGDFVWLHSPPPLGVSPKLHKAWTGPWQISGVEETRVTIVRVGPFRPICSRVSGPVPASLSSVPVSSSSPRLIHAPFSCVPTVVVTPPAPPAPVPLRRSQRSGVAKSTGFYTEY